jgi:hypothetical protein
MSRHYGRIAFTEDGRASRTRRRTRAWPRTLVDVAAGSSGVERVVTVAVAAYDENWRRHIVRRCTARELQPQVLRLVSEVGDLRDENRLLHDQLRLAVAAAKGES